MSVRADSRQPPKRLLDYLNLAREHLETKGIESARLDAELMLAEVLGLSRIELYTNHDRPLTPVDWFATEARFAGHLGPLGPDDPQPTPVAAYLALPI